MSSNRSFCRQVIWQIKRILLIFACAAVGYYLGDEVAGRLLYGMRDGGVQRAETFVFWWVFGGGLGSVVGAILNDIISHRKKRKEMP